MKTAKLFQNGRSQAVRLPKDCRFDGEEVYVRKIGDAVVLLPRNYGWDSLFDSLNRFSSDFMADRHQPPSQEREQAFS